MSRVILICIVTALIVAGCAAVGPGTIPRDRFDYNAAISNSWKEQTLLNIVKLRYADIPLFVEVVSIVNGYTLEGSVNLGGTASSTTAVQGDFVTLGTSGKFIDRPTITYAPITGQQFNKSFMTPIPPGAVLFLIQSGWPVDVILPITVDSINGLRARVAAGASRREGNIGFYRVIELLRKIQKSGAIGMQVRRGSTEKETAVLFFHKKDTDPSLKPILTELNKLLGLAPDTRELEITYGMLPQSDTEIALLTRSMLQIMIALAIEVDVPARHVDEGRTAPAPPHRTGPHRPRAS